MITIFTPTYNREKELNNLYKSLLKQDFKDFEWLIVDDGSSDNTKDFIDSIKKDKKIKVNYIYKENGGKQSAYNVGLDNAKGDIFLCIDSDDILTNNALKKINSDFTNIKDNKIAGIIYLNNYINKKKELVGTPFPSEDLLLKFRLLRITVFLLSKAKNLFLRLYFTIEFLKNMYLCVKTL